MSDDGPQIEPPARRSLISVVERGGIQQLSLQGHLVFQEALEIWNDVRARIADLKKGDRIDFEMSDVQAIDGGTMALLVHLRSELAARGVQAEFAGAGDYVQE